MLRKGLKNFSLDNIHPAPIEGKKPQRLFFAKRSEPL